jgi:hypothetical protein
MMVVSGSLTAQPGGRSSATEPEIVTWNGNTLEWNQRLGVTMLRMGCSLAPSTCLQRLRVAAQTQEIARWAIAIKGDAAKLESDALEYSERSLDEGRLIEIDIDDFVGVVQGWRFTALRSTNEVLAAVIRNVKVRNPRLLFGITLYEDELDSQTLMSIPSETRSRIDRVSLYLHYRGNAKMYRRYATKVQQLFPGAAIRAGSYAYDRIDYLPCAESGTRSCSVAEEIELYRESLMTQLALMREGTVIGIEFYPGFFGIEEQWSGWVQSRICRPGRTLACVETTRRMRVIAATALEERR